MTLRIVLLICFGTAAACSSDDGGTGGRGNGDTTAFAKAWAYKHVQVKGDADETCTQFLDIPGDCTFYPKDVDTYLGPYVGKCTLEVSAPFVKVTCSESADCPTDGTLLFFYSDGDLEPGKSTYNESPDARQVPATLRVGDDLCDGLK